MMKQKRLKPEKMLCAAIRAKCTLTLHNTFYVFATALSQCSLPNENVISILQHFKACISGQWQPMIMNHIKIIINRRFCNLLLELHLDSVSLLFFCFKNSKRKSRESNYLLCHAHSHLWRLDLPFRSPWIVV